MKTCAKCDEEKPLDEFHRSRGKPQGRMSRCRSCEAERSRQRYYRDVEKSRARGRLHSQTHRQTPRGRATSLLGQAKRRARLQGVHCTLSAEWIAARIEQGHCEISRLPFDMSTGNGRWKKQPYAPSIDRVTAGGEYTEKNCRVVCLVLNEAMGQWGLQPVLELAVALLERKNG